MKLTIELDREVDGRWIAAIPELNILVYGAWRPAAVERAKSAARHVLLDRIAQGELPPGCEVAEFEYYVDNSVPGGGA